jgi:hypothetical protein
MKFTWRRVWLFSTGTIACLATAMSEDGSFKVIPGRASLDGHFAIGYGINDLTKTPLPELHEAPPDDAEFDRRFLGDLRAAGDAAEPVPLKNYLVDRRTHRALTVLPGFAYFPGKNHFDLELGWSVDGKAALAIYRTRYNNGSVVWIDTRNGRVTAIGQKLEREFESVLAQDKGKSYTRRRKEYAISFFDPIVTRSGDVIVGWAEANIPKQLGGFDYALRFHVAKDNGRPDLVLVCAKIGGDDIYDQPLENPKEEMKRAYRRLLGRLQGTARRTLEREQAEWERLAGEDSALSTDRRARDLDLRRRLLCVEK